MRLRLGLRGRCRQPRELLVVIWNSTGLFSLGPHYNLHGYKSIFTQPTPQKYKTEEVSFHSAAPTMRNVKIDFHSARYHHFNHLHWIEIFHYLPAGAWKPRTQCFCGELASWSTGKTPQRLWRRWLCQRLRSDHRGNSQARPNREEAAKAACEAAEAEFQACSQVAKGEVSKRFYFMHDLSMWCQIRKYYQAFYDGLALIFFFRWSCSISGDCKNSDSLWSTMLRYTPLPVQLWLWIWQACLIIRIPFGFAPDM